MNCHWQTWCSRGCPTNNVMISSLSNSLIIFLIIFEISPRLSRKSFLTLGLFLEPKKWHEWFKSDDNDKWGLSEGCSPIPTVYYTIGIASQSRSALLTVLWVLSQFVSIRWCLKLPQIKVSKVGRDWGVRLLRWERHIWDYTKLRKRKNTRSSYI